MKIITVSREFGSGGRELGKRLSDCLGWPYYDREIISAVARRNALDEGYVEDALEQGDFRGVPLTIGRTFAYLPSMPHDSRQLLQEQRRVLRALAAHGDCIIVGRCADHVLESKHVDCLSLFICAPFDWRVHHRMEIENVDEKTAAALVEKTDKQREKYYTHYTARPWGLPENYDLCINSARLGIDRTASLLAQHCRELFNDLP